ncbi:MAG: type II toxin-antitoxin system YoeB family toxin, partial [Ignavibacteria bacterium]|nr:type II toxin-antitoxin system YoeB family toxin [Ignavibacteria bacterium]
NTELLEPHWRGIYSFRIDQKYRALFIMADGEAEIFQITNHYKK